MWTRTITVLRISLHLASTRATGCDATTRFDMISLYPWPSVSMLVPMPVPMPMPVLMPVPVPMLAFC